MESLSSKGKEEEERIKEFDKTPCATTSENEFSDVVVTHLRPRYVKKQYIDNVNKIEYNKEYKYSKDIQ